MFNFTTLYIHKLSIILQQHEKSVFEQVQMNIISHATNWTHQNHDLPEVFSMYLLELPCRVVVLYLQSIFCA